MATLAEPSVVQSATPCAGIGVTYEGGDPVLLQRMLPLVDYIEVTPETIAEQHGDRLALSPAVLAELRAIGSAAKIVVHGVSLSIGSHDGWSSSYFGLLDELLEQIDIAWHSEHLGYTKVDGQHLGIMLAMPKTTEALDVVCKRVDTIQSRYRLPFLLENIVHVIPDAPGDYSEAGFLNALADRTGCGLILDAYNLECDAHNHGFDIPAFLDELDASHVRELHVACGVEDNGFLLDVHSRVARPSTLDLAQRIVRKAGGRAQVVTYEFMPEAVAGLGHDAIADQLTELRKLFARQS
jgi:uncharacterized protein (UPF0276 family)